jgi:hypothetical protein
MQRARYQTRQVYLHPNDCIDFVQDLGGGTCDGLFGTHDFVETYIPLLTPWLLSQLAALEASEVVALEAIYQAVLGRAMDDSGRQTYSALLAQDWTLGQVRDTIAHSPEARSRLDEIYQTVLGRAPNTMEDSGWSTWRGALANGWTLGQVRDAIAHTPEAQAQLAAIYQAGLGPDRQP